MMRLAVRTNATLLLLLLAACASGAPANEPVPTPPPVAITEPPLTPGRQVGAGQVGPTSLEPSAAAQRASEQIELTGTELGRMWTFENPPLDYWNAEYGFNATPEWLEHVRLSSVRYGEICSASFVSPNGLVMTNHHCARECIEAASASAPVDYIEAGFYARTQQDELECPGLYLDQLIEIEDVTDRVHNAAPSGGAAAAIAEAQAAEIGRIESECERASGRTCQVVSLYQGGQFQLYQYKRFSPVKLVFAPEGQAGFFGGDPDNFTYPRYDLDVSFVRAYEGADPASTADHYFPWRAEGAAEDELVFVTGNPGSTSRLITVAQAMYEQRYRHPFLIQLLEGQLRVIERISAMSPDAERSMRQDRFEIENSLKAYRGQLAGLRDTLLIARKIRWERELRGRITSDPNLNREFGDLWDRMAALQVRRFQVSPPLNMANPNFLGVPQFVFADTLIAYLREMAKPEAERSQTFRAQQSMIEELLRAPNQNPMDIITELLAVQLSVATTWLAPSDPLRSILVQPNETPIQAAQRLATASRILNPAFRGELISGGLAAARASSDPFVQFALVADTLYPKLEEQWAAIQAEQQVQAERLAGALFAAYGTSQPPDATFTLRIADGRVQRYPYNGTFAPPFTTLYGLYARAAEFSNQMPWTLASTFASRRSAVDMSTPINMVSTNDITGGNSGSPVIDRQGRIVGLAFDGNIEQLPNEFVFRTEAGRTVSVHSAGILEALRNVYQADRVVQELTNGGG